MATILKANSELVAVAWIKGVTGISESAVGTTLPRDNNAWAETGFVQVQGIGGNHQVHVPVAEPNIRVFGWACSPSSNKPPKGKAANLLQLIIAGTYANDGIRTVELPHDYPPARVMGVYPINVPRPAPGDAASYARFYLDLRMHWVEVE